MQFFKKNAELVSDFEIILLSENSPFQIPVKKVLLLYLWASSYEEQEYGRSVLVSFHEELIIPVKKGPLYTCGYLKL